MKLPNGYGSVVKLSGKRRKPYQVRKTVGWHYDEEKGRRVQEMATIGYAATRAEGLQMLAEYNNSPYDARAAKMTFKEVYEEWSKRKFPTISESSLKGYITAFKSCESLYGKVFKNIKLVELQNVVDHCGKNFPTMKGIKVLFNQLYAYALKNDICTRNYSVYVDIIQYKDRNPNKYNRTKFERGEIEKIWEREENEYYQMVLMLIYSGVRVSELLNLKKTNVHLGDQYFDVTSSKTENGIRKVPIADKVLPFYKSWYDSCPECEYLVHTKEGKHLLYHNYYETYFLPRMKELKMEHTPHCCRYTCISMLAEAGINQTIIKKIAGHTGAMTLTEKVYTHFDITELVEAINQI